MSVEPGMKYLYFFVVITLVATPALAKQYSAEKQAQLDGKCEVAREKKLIPVRQQFVDECVSNKELPSLEECRRFYADYGGRMGQRPPLFYDLPECVEAFDYRQSVRRGD